MATFNILSTILTNRDATPKVLSDALLAKGEVCDTYGQIQTSTASDGVDSLYRMFSIPSNARIASIVLQADALGSGCKLDVGVYWPTFIPVGAGLSASNQSAVIATQFFCSALGCSAATAATNVMNSNGANTIAKQELPLWSAIGLSADPGIDLDIVVHVNAAVAAQGFIGLRGNYVKQ